MSKRRLFDRAIADGVIVVAAAGNEGETGMNDRRLHPGYLRRLSWLDRRVALPRRWTALPHVVAAIHGGPDAPRLRPGCRPD